MTRGREHGDRGRFLADARQRLARGRPANRVHPMEPAGSEVPVPVYTNVGREALDGDALVDVFARAVEAAGGHCQVVDGEPPEVFLDRLVSELDAWEVVVSEEPEARALGDRLAGRGVTVGPATPGAAAKARLGITSARAGVAATGSVVLDSSRAGGRVASVLPPVHLCVVPAERIVAAPGDVLRPLGGDPGGLPPSLVLVTGPSRSGDIEQILTIGAHGPTRLHVLVIR